MYLFWGISLKYTKQPIYNFLFVYNISGKHMFGKHYCHVIAPWNPTLNLLCTLDKKFRNLLLLLWRIRPNKFLQIGVITWGQGHGSDESKWPSIVLTSYVLIPFTAYFQSLRLDNQNIYSHQCYHDLTVKCLYTTFFIFLCVDSFITLRIIEQCNPHTRIWENIT